MTPSGDLLVFRYEGLASRSDSFFSELNKSESLQAEFVADPIRVLSDRVLELPEALTDVEIGKSTRFMSSLLNRVEP